MPLRTPLAPEAVRLAAWTPADADWVQCIADQQLGPAYVDPRHWDAPAMCALVARTPAGDGLGFAAGQRLAPEALAHLLAPVPPPIRAALEPLAPFGRLATAATAPGAEGRGVGSRLTRELAEALAAAGARTLIATAWRSPRGVHVGGVLQRLGLRPVCDLTDYWAEESRHARWRCAVCGAPPCRCTAVLFVGPAPRA